MIAFLTNSLATLKGFTWGTWISGALVSILAVLLPSPFVATLLLTTLALVGLDTVTGVMAAKKRGQKIKSAKFGRLVEKLLGVGVLWTTMALVGNLMAVMLATPGIGVILISAGIGAVAAKESLSILENLMRVGIYVNPKLKAKLLDWLGDLEDKG